MADSEAARCSALATARTPARALLIPRRRPGERTPLAARLKAQGRSGRAQVRLVPVILETYRGASRRLRPACAERLSRGSRPAARLVDVETANAPLLDVGSSSTTSRN